MKPRTQKMRFQLMQNKISCTTPPSLTHWQLKHSKQKNNEIRSFVSSDISKSPQVRFLLAWCSLNYFFVYQPVVTNSMYFQSIHNPHLQTFNGMHLSSSSVSVVRPFLRKKLTCSNRWLFLRRSSSVIAWQDSKCNSPQ